jgi:hypothetical protein
MNVIAPQSPATTQTAQSAPEPMAADLLAAWPVAPGALLLLGRAETEPPASGTAQYERRRSDRGPFRCISWPAGAEAGGGIRFAAAVRLPSNTEIRPAQTLTLMPPDSAPMRARLPAEMAGPLGFAADAAQLVAPAGGAWQAALVRFLSGSFPPAALRSVPAAGAMLAALLAELACKDGCVELMGAIPGACGFLQGWGGPVRPSGADGAVDAFLVGARLTRCRARLAGFARPDIVAPAGGVVLVLPDDAADDLGGVERVYLVGETSVARRDLLERRLLGALESVGHIRDMLPALRCAPATADCLRLALRPRYEGRETLTAQSLPVRAAVDLALTVPDAAPLPGGAYLSGWLYDPAEHVADVFLRGTAGAGARLDQGWTRVPRQDVTEAMAGTGFPAPARHDHGFAVHVEASGLAASGALYLDIGFRDGTCAFLPVRTQPIEDLAARARAFEGTDLHKPSGIAIVERQLGPLMRSLMARTPAPVAAAQAGAPGWAVAIVVPLFGPPALPRSFLSQYLRDRLAPDEGLMLVCGAGWSEGDAARLQRLTGFMDLPALVLRAPGAVDALAALAIAAAAAPATGWLLLADASTAGCAPGWRTVLRAAAARASGRAVVCPTLLYEDFSIRYAGGTALDALAVAPYAAVRRALAGMPAALADDGAPQPAEFGTLACCLLPRAALPALERARAGLTTPFGQEAAAFLGLRAAGVICLWVPRARVFAPEIAANASPGDAVARLVDGWCLRAAHAGGAFAPTPPPVPESRACAS